tara:strand:- start:277 stop:525 length:249 start_codon:yes stop_codon:yes gene_type:complete
MLQRSEVAQQLKNLIEESREIVINSNDEKLDIDSFTMMLVIMYVKENFGIQLNLNKMDFDVFTSLNTLADLVLDEAAGKPSA